MTYNEAPRWTHNEALVIAMLLAAGAAPRVGMTLHVDHIKPRSKHPDLETEPSNLQVLCDACNLGKSNKDDTDWRRK